VLAQAETPRMPKDWDGRQMYLPFRGLCQWHGADETATSQVGHPCARAAHLHGCGNELAAAEVERGSAKGPAEHVASCTAPSSTRARGG
jgi:hypothetical protein